MYGFLKKLISYFRTIEIYEINSNFKSKISKKYKFKVYNKLSNIKSPEILNYFKEYKNKKKRFKNNCMFLTLSLNNKLVSSGWLFIGKNWIITEINKYLNVSNKIIIFDFITLEQYRNKGYYTKLLKLIRKKFKNKNILIYVLSSNLKSKRAIKKAGFIFQKKLRALN